MNKISIITGPKSNVKINGDVISGINFKAIFRGNLQEKIHFELTLLAQWQ